MEKVVVAFENQANCQRICTTLESCGGIACIPCRSAGEVRRLLAKQQISVVVCGYKLADATAEELCEDLAPTVCMLLMAPWHQLELCQSDDLFRLATPTSKGELITSVRLLLQTSRRMERLMPSRRSEEEQHLLWEAKELLIRNHGMTEEQAHRFIQKKSMDAGYKMVQTARLILGGMPLTD